MLQRYAKVLKDSGSEEAAHCQLVCNDIDGSVETLIEREEYEDAKLLKILADSRVFKDPLARYKSLGAPVDPKALALKPVELGKLPESAVRALKEIAQKEAEEFFSSGEMVLSACAELSVSNVEAAIVQLIRGNELALAFAISVLLKSETVDEVRQLLGLRAERLELFDYAAKYYAGCKNRRLTNFFAVRCGVDHAGLGLKPKEEYYGIAKAASDVAESVQNYLFAWKLEEACTVAVERILSMRYILSRLRKTCCCFYSFSSQPDYICCRDRLGAELRKNGRGRSARVLTPKRLRWFCSHRVLSPYYIYIHHCVRMH